ncbi:MAG: elongation factor P maturation arginine rhamnosyltransferase EarP [Chitinivorax sp.]
MSTLQSVDLFCKVIDNYGDIGVCWRLARQLRQEHGLQVRLWVDDLASFRPLCPELHIERSVQQCRGVDIYHWQGPLPAVSPHQLVIEAFACDLPPEFVAAMAQQPEKPIWINLEYLSAEPWVEDCHQMASLQPRWALTKCFFFPGFSPATGGLLCEQELLSQRRQFQSDLAMKAEFWRSLGVPMPQKDELRVSLFAYENRAVASLLQAMAAGERRVTCLLPLSRVAGDVFDWLGVAVAQPGQRFERGALTVQVLPFVEQPVYDRLLWACDINFVRGEDSLVRAQWAARPLIWHIYPQEEGAHWPKLDALLERYCQQMDSTAAAALRSLWHAWNQQSDVADAWRQLCLQQAVLSAHADKWADYLVGLGDLAANLLHFCKKIS